MPVYVVRGMDGQVGIVAARNREDAVERLDEFADFEGCPIRELPDVMLLLRLDDDGEMALQQLGDEMEESIRQFAYPRLDKLWRSGQAFENQELTREAVKAKRERVQPKETRATDGAGNAPAAESAWRPQEATLTRDLLTSDPGSSGPLCGSLREFVLVVTGIAVLGARSAPRDTGNQPRALPGYQGRSPWLVGDMCPFAGVRPVGDQEYQPN